LHPGTRFNGSTFRLDSPGELATSVTHPLLCFLLTPVLS
jgi:hypothetical protein